MTNYKAWSIFAYVMAILCLVGLALGLGAVFLISRAGTVLVSIIEGALLT